MRKLSILLLCFFAGDAVAEPVVIRARIRNGTRHVPGAADKVTLFQLGAGMQPIRELGAVSGSFELDGLDLDRELPYLVRLSANGVSYSELVQFSDGARADLQFTVYDATTEQDDVSVTLARVTMARRGDVLQVRSTYVVENHSEPPKTLYDPDGTFRFTLPGPLIEIRSVSASSSSGVPVPQSAELEEDGASYVTRTAFKPGSTEIAVSYEVDYQSEQFTWTNTPQYDIPTLVVLVSPSDVEVEADADWEVLSPGPSSRFLVLRRRDVSQGETLEATLRGGTSPLAPPPTDTAAPHGTVTTMPDASAARRGLVIVLMTALLAFGLLKSLYSSSFEDR